MMHAAFELIDPNDVVIERINDSVKNMEDYTDHEHVFRIENKKHGVILFVGVHDTTLGPSLGGLRFAPYESEEKAIKDVLRLARGMSYKNSVAALDLGGGKAVGMAPSGQKAPGNAFLETAALGFNRVNEEYRAKFAAKPGIYYTAEDVGTKVPDMKKIARHCAWVVGARGEAPDPSPQTARGVVAAIRVSVRKQYGSGDLTNKIVSVQGIGNVGMEVVRILWEEEGVNSLIVSDLDPAALHKAKNLYGAKIADPDKIFDAKADVFSPCAMGGALSESNIDKLYTAGVRVVAGGANNQEPDEKSHAQSKYMRAKGMTYAPDFVANLGGVVWVAKEGEVVENPASASSIKRGIVRAVINSLNEVFRISQDENLDTGTAAERFAKARILNAATASVKAKAASA